MNKIITFSSIYIVLTDEIFFKFGISFILTWRFQICKKILGSCASFCYFSAFKVKEFDKKNSLSKKCVPSPARSRRLTSIIEKPVYI